MRTLQEVVGEELAWVKPKRSKLQFELRAGEAVVATLARARGSRAIGRWAGGHYRFNREGWFRPRVLVREAPAEAPDAWDEVAEPVATLAQRGGALTLRDGRTFIWKKPRRWTNERVWVDDTATTLVHFHPAARRSPATVTIQAAAAALPELPLLLLLGQYLVVLAAQDAEAATTAAAVSVIASS